MLNVHPSFDPKTGTWFIEDIPWALDFKSLSDMSGNLSRYVGGERFKIIGYCPNGYGTSAIAPLAGGKPGPKKIVVRHAPPAAMKAQAQPHVVKKPNPMLLARRQRFEAKERAKEAVRRYESRLRDFQWTDENRETGKKMWRQGCTMLQIAERIGTTRNSISGAIYRWGWSR